MLYTKLRQYDKIAYEKLISSHSLIILQCHCRRREEWKTEEKCGANTVVYECIASATVFPNKVYLGTAQGEF